MPETTPTYDLVLLLSTTASEEDRGSRLSDVESAISTGGGELLRRDDWGTRPLTFKINHQRDAEYHLLQFAGPPALLETLSHNLHIADDVLRFRIIKVIPGTPEAPASPPPVIAGVGASDTRSGAGEGRPERESRSYEEE